MEVPLALESAVPQIVTKLKTAGINFVALDFDFTLIDVHTGGRWQESADMLAARIRPFFQLFVPEVNKAGLQLAIVTFSPQTDMIKEVFKKRFGEGLAYQIPIRGEDGTWNYRGNGSRQGKQGHMASAAQELQSRSPGLDIHRGSTVLIDDDRSNVEVALRAGVKAFWLDPRRPDTVIKSMLHGL